MVNEELKFFAINFDGYFYFITPSHHFLETAYFWRWGVLAFTSCIVQALLVNG